jgi:hypothetical protein
MKLSLSEAAHKLHRTFGIPKNFIYSQFKFNNDKILDDNRYCWYEELIKEFIKSGYKVW